MSPPPSSPPFASSLRVGDRVVSLCNDGLLAAEATLFDASEVLLRASAPPTLREAGYLTTAGRALERLMREGVTVQLAHEAARAIPRVAIAMFARGEAVRRLSTQMPLGPHELFDGAIFRATATPPRYEGMWLDLRALAEGARVEGAALLFQALHLASALSEVADDTPVHLATAEAVRERLGRAPLRPSFDGIGNLPDALGAVRPQSPPVTLDMAREPRLQAALLARVRERLAAGPRREHDRAHLIALERALLPQAGPAGPLGSDDLRAVERQVEAGDPEGVDERLDRLEASLGSVPGIRYLRARVALLRGERPPKYVARELSELAEYDHGFHEATVGAARTWLAAGEEAKARYFARQLVADPNAKDSERLVALEILDTTERTGHSSAPPPPDARAEIIPATVPTSRSPRSPDLGPVPPPRGFHQEPSAPPPPVGPRSTFGHADPARPPPRARAAPRHARYDPELVESLALPAGCREEDLPLNARPLTPAQARVAMTRLARDLARDYRLWYGRTMRCDLASIDVMQQHLRARYSSARIEDEAVAWELRRHGALLSEVIARALGGVWLDVTPSEPGYWTMMVPPAVRTCPIGRVYRFLALGRQERDLVGHYAALEDAAR